MILSHIRVIWHALLACLLLAGSAPQIPALCLYLITVKHIRRWRLRLVHINARAYTWHHTPPKKNLSVVCVTNSVLMHFLLGVCYLFSSAWFLLAIHYSCFLHTHTTCFFLAFRLFLMLSFYFPPASLLCLLWAALWCHVASPAQLSGPGELGIILSFLITVLDTLNSVELNFFMWNMLHRNSQLIPYIEDLDISNQIWVESNKHLIKKKVCLSYFQPFLKTIDTLLTFWLIRIDMYTEL